MPLDAPIDFSYRMSRLFHQLMFEPGKNLYGLMAAISRDAQGSKLEGAYHKLEHLAKVLIFDCHDCGDCALIDVAYSCPMSQCPKNQRNGACGGSFNGWCEVYPEKRRCVYVIAYARLKNYGEETGLDGRPRPPVQLGLLSDLLVDQLLPRQGPYRKAHGRSGGQKGGIGNGRLCQLTGRKYA